uniref:Rho guanine nucleotide exchange factor 17 n=1 Tax=Petromyzon marinus TaxID=7757 RepID=A0AAJ7T718_PETMA|nr:rho guanine nucleotide exchange factor 17 [Petromyzon marinus]XP_032812503.1 rho guanine nucleotide exchange factor 17 [Petromyzon marinus]XP_032812504.1 rho guanine nucleotide exchange factor 17 [Petromyzon marinus]
MADKSSRRAGDKASSSSGTVQYRSVYNKYIGGRAGGQQQQQQQPPRGGMRAPEGEEATRTRVVAPSRREKTKAAVDSTAPPPVRKMHNVAPAILQLSRHFQGSPQEDRSAVGGGGGAPGKAGSSKPLDRTSRRGTVSPPASHIPVINSGTKRVAARERKLVEAAEPKLSSSTSSLPPASPVSTVMSSELSSDHVQSSSTSSPAPPPLSPEVHLEEERDVPGDVSALDAQSHQPLGHVQGTTGESVTGSQEMSWPSVAEIKARFLGEGNRRKPHRSTSDMYDLNAFGSSDGKIYQALASTNAKPDGTRWLPSFLERQTNYVRPQGSGKNSTLTPVQSEDSDGGRSLRNLGRSVSLSPIPEPKVTRSRLERICSLQLGSGGKRVHRGVAVAGVQASPQTSYSPNGRALQDGAESLKSWCSSSTLRSVSSITESSGAEEDLDRGRREWATAKRDGSDSKEKSTDRDRDNARIPMLCRNSQKRRPIRKKKSSFGEGGKNDSDSDSDLSASASLRRRRTAMPGGFHGQSPGNGSPKSTFNNNQKIHPINLACVSGFATLPKSKEPRGLHGHREEWGGARRDSSLEPDSPGVSPVVSKVTKVNLQSFLNAANSSKSSSRYSSTETLTEEDTKRTYWVFGSVGRMMKNSEVEGMGKLTKSNVRLRPKLPFGIMGDKQGTEEPGMSTGQKSLYRKSLSNPDFTSETMALLSYLKSDFSNLKVRNSGERSGSYGSLPAEQSETEAMDGEMLCVENSTAASFGGRLTLKELTETLRQTKMGASNSSISSERSLSNANISDNFTVPDSLDDSEGKEVGENSGRSLSARVMEALENRPRTKREAALKVATCASHQELPIGGDALRSYPGVGSEVASWVYDNDDEDANGEDDEDGMMEALRMSVESEDGFRSMGSLEGLRRVRPQLEDLEEEESSMTDEGIVTEPETGAVAGSYSRGVAKSRQLSGVGEVDGQEKTENWLRREVAPTVVTTVRSGVDSISMEGDIKGGGPASAEPPLTPSTSRRRRKFSALGNNGSDSSNGSNGESNGESYRSLSDPMPHRKCPAAEETEIFPVDSNFLGSLGPSRAGIIPGSSATMLAECGASAASDLSVCSEEVKDYSTMIHNIVNEPGAMDKVVDERGNGKVVKKKSLSDPSRRGDGGMVAATGSRLLAETISETEAIAGIPSARSEPTLAEKRAEDPGDPDDFGKPRSQSEKTLPLPSGDEDYGVGSLHAPMQDLGFDPKLLSPRIVRRNSKKRSIRVLQNEGGRKEDGVMASDDQSQQDLIATAEDVDLSVEDLRCAATELQRSHSEDSAFIRRPLADDYAKDAACTPTAGYPPDGGLVQRKLQNLGGGVNAMAPTAVVAATSVVAAVPAAGSPAGVSRVPSVKLATSEVVPTATVSTAQTLSKSRAQETPPVEPIVKAKVDMRKHVMMNLLDTERSYVESLRTLVQGYLGPLKQAESAGLCDPALVDDMFFQIPEILEHHERFLEQLTGCVQCWHERQTVGDIIIESFSKDILANSYSAYIDNFLNAKDAVRLAKEAKPAFNRFLEQCMRENKEKQALADLMIKPVQRIPRYELLIKDLLKHTPEEHPDHSSLTVAQRDVRLLAERINQGKRDAEEAERAARVLQEVEAHIEGATELVAPLRKFLKQEMVVEVKGAGGKKDRSLFLFTDLLLCTTLKKKSGSLRRSSMNLYTAGCVIDTSSKYKLLWKVPLEDVDVMKGLLAPAPSRDSLHKALTRLEGDFSTLSQISTLAETLSITHQTLDEVIKELMACVNRELSERQLLAASAFATVPPSGSTQSLTSPLSAGVPGLAGAVGSAAPLGGALAGSLGGTLAPARLELSVAPSAPDASPESFVFEFTGGEPRAAFEQMLEETKRKLAQTKDRWDPEFLKAIPIMKTRSGMQFSCASPSLGAWDHSSEVWVCNSDGYVGQVCLLSVRPDPMVEACIAVCSARILCIAPVPGLGRGTRDRPASHRPLPEIPSSDDIGSPPALDPAAVATSSSSSSSSSSSPSQLQAGEQRPPRVGAAGNPFASDAEESEGEALSPTSRPRGRGSKQPGGARDGRPDFTLSLDDRTASKDPGAETTSSDDEHEDPARPSISSACSAFQPVASAGSIAVVTAAAAAAADGRAMRRTSRGSFQASLEELLSMDPEAHTSSMWLGTEDGCIHVYQSSDNIRNRKNSLKMQHPAAVMCILYLDNKVFVSLLNGDLIVYQREAGCFWDSQHSHTLTVGSPGNPVTKMAHVAGRLWCSCQNIIVVINTANLVPEHTFTVGSDASRAVSCLVASGLGVWVSVQSSASVRLYHAQTRDCLAEIDVAPAVHKMLAGADAIIRQHKAACLRVTALLACKDMLWVGTSAGVLLTLPLPHIPPKLPSTARQNAAAAPLPAPVTVAAATAATATSPLGIQGPPLLAQLLPMGSTHGHTGHVRFLTSIELPLDAVAETGPVGSADKGRLGTIYDGGCVNPHHQQQQQQHTWARQGSARRRAQAAAPPRTRTLVISGGDGYEDFRLSGSNESAGRDDSTNHLLLWRV